MEAFHPSFTILRLPITIYKLIVISKLKLCFYTYYDLIHLQFKQFSLFAGLRIEMMVFLMFFFKWVVYLKLTCPLFVHNYCIKYDNDNEDNHRFTEFAMFGKK